jgi:hypothetical protein
VGAIIFKEGEDLDPCAVAGEAGEGEVGISVLGERHPVEDLLHQPSELLVLGLAAYYFGLAHRGGAITQANGEGFLIWQTFVAYVTHSYSFTGQYKLLAIRG